MTEKLISYALYGQDPTYLTGAIRNAEQIAKFYPGWTACFYTGETIPTEIISNLIELGSIIRPMKGKENSAAMFWRIKAFFEPGAKMVLVRDADSRFSEREVAAVKEWQQSDRGFHIMRDHPGHRFAMLGGLWGARTDRLTALKEIIENYKPAGHYGEDQQFLHQYIYPLAKRDAIIHDSYCTYNLSSRRFSLPRTGYEFVGERIGADEQPLDHGRNAIAFFEASFYQRLRLKVSSFIKGPKK